MDELFITSVHDGRNKYFLISKNFVRRIEEEYGEYLKVGYDYIKRKCMYIIYIKMESCFLVNSCFLTLIVLIKNVLSDHVFLCSVLTKPFCLVPAFGEHLTYSLSCALLVFSIHNPSMPTQFP